MPRSIYFAVLFAALAVFEIEKSPRVAASGSPKPLGSPEFAGDGKLVRPGGVPQMGFSFVRLWNELFAECIGRPGAPDVYERVCAASGL